MEHRALATVLAALALVCGCAEVRIVRATGSPTQEGLRFYRPHPYLLVTNTQEGKQAQIVWLPNLSEEYVADVVGGMGTVDASITLEHGWNLTALNDKRDSQLPEMIGAVTGTIKDIAALRASIDPEVGLWRLDFSEAGLVTGATRLDLLPPEEKTSDAEASKETPSAAELLRQWTHVDDDQAARLFEARTNIEAMHQRVASLLTKRLSEERALYSMDEVALPVGPLYEDATYLANAFTLLSDPESRIIGGEETKNFPDCVAVGTGHRWCCTGTLVASNVVLTAGHCWDGECDVRVFFGPDVDHPEQGRVVDVKAAIPHPRYDGSVFLNDLTVLLLEEDVTDVPPRAFAEPGHIDSSIGARLVGYGTTDPGGTIGYGKRRSVDVPVVSPACARKPGEDDPYGCHKDHEIVAGEPFLERDSCRGDSGGPAFVRVDGQWYLAGATSRATANSTRPCGDGGIYVRLDRYADWIRSVPGGHWPK